MENLTETTEPTVLPARKMKAARRLFGFADLGIDPDSVSSNEMRRIRITSFSTLAMLLVAVLYFFEHLALGIHSMCAALIVAFVAALANLALLQWTRNATLGANFGITILGGMLIFSNYTSGGFYQPNFSWLYLLPICAAVVLRWRGAAIWTLVTLSITLAFWSLPELGVELDNQIPAAMQNRQALFHRVTAIVAMALIAIGFVAAQRRAEQELATANEGLSRETAYVQLLQHAAISANEATSFDDALRESIEHICKIMDWTAGHILHVNAAGQVASSGTVHVEVDGELVSLQRRSEKIVYCSGEGLPGRAVASRIPQCICNLETAEGLGERAKIALAVGIRSGFAVPVLMHGDVRAVLEFGSSRIMDEDERLHDVFAHVGVQLGRVAERTAMHERLRESQRLEAVGQLAAGLAHEINNPMSYARANLQMLRQEWSELTAKLEELPGVSAASISRLQECDELIDESIEGVERTISIVRDVREFSHFGGAGRDAWSPANPKDLLEDALRVASTHTSPGVHFDRIYDEVPAIECAPNQLRQVFVNLLVNAVQAMGSQGTIRLSTQLDEDEVVAVVEDDGPGMTEETRERLFDPFFTTKPVGEGTGLGLYVSYEIVKGHDGRIVVTSQLGHGTRFEVRLPRSDRAGPIPEST